MSILHKITRRLAATVAAGLVATVAGTAQAGVIASFDPAFGLSIPNLGFRGTITLDVTPGCYALGSGFQFTGGACQIVAQSAQVNFYNSTTSSADLTTVNLAGNFFAADYVLGAYFDPLTGQLAGLDTNNSGQFGVSVTDNNPLAPIAYDGSMLLYFVSGTQPPIQINRFNTLAVIQPGVGTGGAFLIDCNPTNQQQTACLRDNGNTSNPGRLTFTTVPEPGSIALGMIGLVGLAATRRRSRNRSTGRLPAI